MNDTLQAIEKDEIYQDLISRAKRAAPVKYEIGGMTFQMPEIPTLYVAPNDGNRSEALIRFDVALTASDKFIADAVTIENDSHLTPEGKQARLDPLRKDLAKLVGWQVSGLDDYEAHLKKMNDDLLGLTATQNETEYLKDSEIRQWWRSLPDAQRKVAMGQMRDDPERFANVARALLSSPIPVDLQPEENQFITHIHRNARLKAHPDIGLKLAHGKSQLDWARRGIAQLRGVLGGNDRLTNGHLREYWVTSDAQPHQKASTLKALGLLDHGTHARIFK